MEALVYRRWVGGCWRGEIAPALWRLGPWRCPGGFSLLLPPLLASKAGESTSTDLLLLAGEARRAPCGSQTSPRPGEGFTSHPAARRGLTNVPPASQIPAGSWVRSPREPYLLGGDSRASSASPPRHHHHRWRHGLGTAWPWGTFPAPNAPGCRCAGGLAELLRKRVNYSGAKVWIKEINQ